MNLKTIPQVAQELNVSEDTIRRKAKQKNLLTNRIGNAWALSPGEVLILRRALRQRTVTRRQGDAGTRRGGKDAGR